MHTIDLDQWLDIDVDAMNEQHKELIKRMNHLYKLSTTGAQQHDVIKGIDDLIEYTRQHFADEEAYMCAMKYGGIAAHKKLHQNILENLQAHREAYAANKSNGLPDTLPSFLKLWLVSNIRGMDTRYRASA